MPTPPRHFPIQAMKALGDFADAFEQGRGLQPSLSTVIGMLSSATVDGVSAVHNGIQYYARLWQPLSVENLPSHRAVLRPRYGEIIAKAPDLKYLFLFHQDGHARQAALDSILAPPALFFYAAILPRLNDWVPEVRTAAVACLNRILPLSDQDTVFVIIRTLFYQSRNWARWTNESSVILETLHQPEMVSRLVAWLRTAGGGRLSAFMRIVLQRPIIDSHLYDLARHAKSPSVRGRALRVLLRGSVNWIEYPPQTSRWRSPSAPLLRTRTLCVPLPPAQDLVDLGLADKSAKVRKVVGFCVVDLAGELSDLNGVIDKLLVDPAAALRWRGDFLNRTLRKPAQGVAL